MPIEMYSNAARSRLVTIVITVFNAVSSSIHRPIVFQVEGFKPIVEEAVTGFHYGKSFVLFKSLMLPWMKAHLKCKEHGMRLITLEGGSVEIGFLKTMFSSNIETTSYRRGWIGATDLLNEGHFTMIDSGRNFPHSLFGVGDPDNYGGNEHCVEFMLEFTVNDQNCEMDNFVICEYVNPRVQHCLSKGA